MSGDSSEPYVFNRNKALTLYMQTQQLSLNSVSRDTILTDLDRTTMHCIECGHRVFKYDFEFLQNLNLLANELRFEFPSSQSRSMSNCATPQQITAKCDEKRKQLRHKIGVIITNYNNSADKRNIIEIINRHNWKNTSYDIDGGVSLKQCAQSMKMRTLDKRLHQIMFLLYHIYILLDDNIYCTKRDLYYMDTERFNFSQRVVDEIVDDLASTFRVSRYELHIISSCRGLVFGHLSFVNTNHVKTDCLLSPNGINIPNETDKITCMSSEARFILIVEKDAIFQLLINQKIHEQFPLIMVTGIGYPDMNTRAFVQLMWNTFNIPILGLTDCNPHGLEIICCYRHGSLGLSYDSENLTVPAIRWFGVLPSDIRRFKLSGNILNPLTQSDFKKIKDLRERPYFIENTPWFEQLNLMERMGYKAEIQSLAEYTPNFLLDWFIPLKIRFGQWV